MKKRVFFCITLFFVSQALYAQYFSWGNERGSTRWNHITTEHFQVIYPQGCDSIAQRCTQILHYVYTAVGNTLQHEPAKISVILHSQSRISNASVAWAPKRIDMFDVVSPMQTPDDWWENLALHEYRHVVQMDKLNEGFTRILYFLLGEQAPSAVAGLYFPSWFMEGDAVVSETALGTAGRGRTADFSMGLRAQLAQKQQFSYTKAYFGSYRDYVPNVYEMGYVVVANTRALYNPYVFAKVAQNVAQHPYSITPFDNALKRETGKNKLQLYDSTFKKQSLEWQLLREREIQKPFDTLIFAGKKIFTSYRFAQQISEHTILAERSGLAHRRQLIAFDTKTKKIKRIANTSQKPADEAFSANEKLVVWAETKPSLRWELTNATFIYTYNVQTHKKRRISTKMRLFAPAVSADASQIVAVEIAANGTYSLQFYNIQKKQWTEKIPLPQGEYALAPTWNADATKIAYVGVSSRGKRLVEYDVYTQQFREILPYSTEDLQSPVYYNSYILYTSSYSGVDNVYAVHSLSGQQWRVTVSNFGAQSPRVYGTTITFSDYSANGFCVGSLPAEPYKWHTKNAVRRYDFPLAETLAWQENSTLDFTKMPDTVFVSRKYSKLAHLFHIHSWSPFYLEYTQNTTNVGIGAQVVSQNMLATAITRLGYKATFDSNPKHVGFAAFRYTGFFPIIDLESEVGTQTISTNAQDVHCTVANNTAAMSLPFVISRGGFSRFFVLQGQAQHMFLEARSAAFRTFSSLACRYSAVFSNMSSTAPRDLNPAWGQRMEISYSHNPRTTMSPLSNYAYSRMDLYVPSMFKNHSIHGAAAADWHQNEGALLFNTQIFVPRGTESMVFRRKEMISSRIEYTLPLFYPDLAWREVFYCARLWATAFCDYALTHSKLQNTTNHYTSYGLDLNAEMHLLHFRAPLTAGVRTAYVQQTQQISCLALLSINMGAL
ncbi:MAG: hypothetical protein LBU90_08440 [Bacteroidales bacterium]|jgi:Tol biopolymer transport system component|nr:hypothetical protein [Bacteroidales bacterium]